MNILEVAEGLKEGRVYSNKGFSSYEYLVMDRYKQVKVFNGYDVQNFEFTTDLLVSEEWFEKKKEKWFIKSTSMEFNLASDDVFLYFHIEREEDIKNKNWSELYFSEYELLEHSYYAEIVMSGDLETTEEELETIKNILEKEKY